MSNTNQNFLFWISVTRFVPQIGCISSTLFGTILLILTYFGARKIFGSYKYLISAFTTLGMAFAVVENFVYPNVHNYKAGALFFSFEESFGLSGKRTKTIPLAGYTFLYAATVSLLSVQFMYRYWAVFDNTKLRFFKIRYSPIWISYCSFFGLQYALGTYFFMQLDPTSSEYFREEILIRYNYNISTFPAMAIVAYDPVDGSVRWWNLMGVFNICSIVNIQYGIMIYCGWTMHTKMEERIKNFSENMKKHHKQFFKSLVLQITAPTIVLFIPITIMIFLPIFNLNASIPSGVMLCSFTLYPAMDSMIVMYVVSDYRMTALKAIRLARHVFEDARRMYNEERNAPSEHERRDA